ncbi:MAG: hypothetical protein A3F54_05595 [Candidatus Kerfeldbacteria bacterium RIFCSPHIGHO2_12_FULL_48_17]|uniref:DUF11 domain-containing protein n=1 Tax=Candidatus Kerfeldbacteria bacterium RIFCSPHIGHO2_12_FULL_48_17 TaxID=1798542 RepID=A0A1G2B5V4_9BACT|nr:MAG: hypothetical protein A3F54_05595 [Candidatus Kerfeldbacteria bacterium RIFCSPHIGHO2_12_FULL_48_17]
MNNKSGEKSEKKRKFVESAQDQDEEEMKKNTQSALSAIYHDEDDEDQVDMTKFETRSKYHYLKVGVFIFLGIAVIATVFLGIYTFRGNSFFRGASADKKATDIEIIGPKSVASGDEVSFDIVVHNRDTVAISKGQLEMRYPTGFRLARTSPQGTNAEQTIWQVPDIQAGAAYKVTIAGQILGEVHTAKDFRATFHYQPSNFSSTFEVTQTHTVNIDSSIIEAEVKIPQQAIPEQELPLEIKIKNTSDKPIDQIKVEIKYPAEFTFVSSKPDSETKNDTWILKNVAAKEDTALAVKGKLKAKASDELTFTTTLSIQNPEGNFTIQQEKENKIKVINPKVDVSFKVNGTSDDSAFSLGDDIAFELSYSNTSDVTLHNAVLEMTIADDFEAYDLKSLDFKEGKTPQIDNNIIRWTNEQIKNFTEIKPGDKSTIKWTIPTAKEASVFPDPPTEIAVQNKMSFRFELEGTDIKKEGLPDVSDTITTRLKSATKLTAFARYYDDNRTKVGAGPLPPEANQETSFRVYWQFENTYNDLKDLTVTTKLPDDVTWDEKFKAQQGNLTYSIENRTVTWYFDKVKAYAGADESFQAYFDVTIHPTQDDMGKVMIINNETQLAATDAFAQTKLSNTAALLTSDIQTDPIGKGEGAVVAETSADPSGGAKNSNSNSNTNSSNKNINK